MNEKLTGGPAFPEAGLSGLPNGEFIYGQGGMTLLDYFAAKVNSPEDMGVKFAEALTGFVLPKRDSYINESDFWVETAGFWAEANAQYRYMQARAMVSVRSVILEEYRQDQLPRRVEQ